MPIKSKGGSLTKEERPIIKSLLNRGWRNQDIQDLVNRCRSATINSARITEVKKSNRIKAATDQETDRYIVIQESWDLKTGLNPYYHERLVKSREAMILAVQLFNNPTIEFKSGAFSILSNIAWTNLLHEYFTQKNKSILRDGNKHLSLSEMLSKAHCPLDSDVKDNLLAIKDIRDAVEHKEAAGCDLVWMPYFQANCFNFDKAIIDLFDPKYTLQKHLSVALQFANLDFDQINSLQKYQLPQHIQTLENKLNEADTDPNNPRLGYKFRVFYAFHHASKGQSHIQFISPDSHEGQEISNVLIKHVDIDKKYPFRPSDVTQKVREKCTVRFTSDTHTKAWKTYKVRPLTNSKTPEATNIKFCRYNSLYDAYSYSEDWIDFLVKEIEDDDKLNTIRSYGKPN